MLIGDYVNELNRALTGPTRTKRDMVAEARDSLVDAADALEAGGLPRREAERLAVAEFGEVGEIAPQYQAELLACAGRRLGWVLAVAGPATLLMWTAIWQLFPGEPATWSARPGWHAFIGQFVDAMQLVTGVLGLLTLLWYRRRTRHARLVARVVAIYVKTLVPMTLVLCVPLMSYLKPGTSGPVVYLPWTIAFVVSAGLLVLQASHAGLCLRLSRIRTA